ncbi:DUF1986 domain-containing protein [Desulfonema magnum]|uniref:Trypsin domain-containing protein n=1 Tax=Desulfonema magnum TaxID=45655 RepID=A0A975GMT3_9BACT|nr:DUF1986 domain-containing protein [Desulfonema magnum]QTA87266.1 Trypsin domain-containing protein [Desulfonema magnum]
MKQLYFIVFLMFLATGSGYADMNKSVKQDASRKASSRIVGGYESEQGAWPWITALVYPDKGSLYDSLMCAGSLVHSNWVVTAAHCAEDIHGDALEPEDIEVVLGVHDLKNDIGEWIKVKRIISHPCYDKKNNWNADIALLELEETVSYPTIRPVAGNAVLDGKEAAVIGWGTTSARNDIFPEKLRQASVCIISNDICNKSYNQKLYYDDPITEYMMCAGRSEGGTDACRNDSGGPLVVPDGDTWKLAGIVSWGEGCAQPDFYGVYTRITAFLDFIYTYVPKSNDTPEAFDDIYTVSQGDEISENAPGILGNDTDADSDTLTAFLINDVSHGSLTLNADGSFTYSHDGGNAVSDNFIYKASDGKADSNTASVTVKINPAKDAASDDGGDGGGCFISNLLE